MNLIVCVDAHWGIGNKGELLVSIPGDKRMFKENTTGKVVLGGRKTMEGLPGGTTLKGRTNIVLTHQKDYTFGDAIIVHSKEEALERLKEYNDEDIFIIGGEVDYRYEADVFFPNLDEDSDWVMTHDSDEQTYYDLEYYFTIYQRKDSLPNHS